MRIGYCTQPQPRTIFVVPLKHDPILVPTAITNIIIVPPSRSPFLGDTVLGILQIPNLFTERYNQRTSSWPYRHSVCWLNPVSLDKFILKQSNTSIGASIQYCMSYCIFVCRHVYIYVYIYIYRIGYR